MATHRGSASPGPTCRLTAHRMAVVGWAEAPAPAAAPGEALRPGPRASAPVRSAGPLPELAVETVPARAAAAAAAKVTVTRGVSRFPVAAGTVMMGPDV